MSAVSATDSKQTQQTSSNVTDRLPSWMTNFSLNGRHLFSSYGVSLSERVTYYPRQLLQCLNTEIFYKTLKVGGTLALITCLIFLPVTGALIPQGEQRALYVCKQPGDCVAVTQEMFINNLKEEMFFAEEHDWNRIGETLNSLNQKENEIVFELVNRANAIDLFKVLPELPDEAITLNQNGYTEVDLNAVTYPLMKGSNPEGRDVMTVRYQEVDRQGNPLNEKKRVVTLVRNIDDEEKWELLGSRDFFRDYFAEHSFPRKRNAKQVYYQLA
jgi:hypothetical protein